MLHYQLNRSPRRSRCPLLASSKFKPHPNHLQMRASIEDRLQTFVSDLHDESFYMYNEDRALQECQMAQIKNPQPIRESIPHIIERMPPKIGNRGSSVYAEQVKQQELQTAKKHHSFLERESARNSRFQVINRWNDDLKTRSQSQTPHKDENDKITSTRSTSMLLPVSPKCSIRDTISELYEPAKSPSTIDEEDESMAETESATDELKISDQLKQVVNELKRLNQKMNSVRHDVQCVLYG